MSQAVFDACRNLAGLVRDAMRIAAWSPDDTILAFTSGPPEQREAWHIDPVTGEKTLLLDIERARAAIARATGDSPSGQGLPFQPFSYIGPPLIAFAIGQEQLPLDLECYVATRAQAPSPSQKARMTSRPFKLSMPLVDPIDALDGQVWHCQLRR